MRRRKTPRLRKPVSYSSDVGELKSGEYLVHMYVEEARQLQTEKE